MRLGLVTPVLTLLPRAHARWEEDGGIHEVSRIVVAADALGYHHVTCSEHVAIPTAVAEVRGGRYWDPLATFGYLAAQTVRIRFATYVLVLGYHHPLAIAKRYGTLDRVSAGRLVLGVGVGSLEDEFDLLGAPFAARGPRADDALRALRAALGQTRPSYRGEHYDFGDVVVDPCAVQAHVPIWVGGRTRRSLRRAATLADGWAPFGLGPDEVVAWLGAARAHPSWAERRQELEVVLRPAAALDPTAEPGAAVDALGALAEAGATIVDVRLVHRSAGHCVEQLEALIRLAEA
ncbi:MAG: TIGR03619 family F420-dependent LLM class oxidoreductase [Actinomycetota bacterium]|nr:TIGR03619 family F420-dependent LLM class oxidoreductase [Actinomycetota bacterium]